MDMYYQVLIELRQLNVFRLKLSHKLGTLVLDNDWSIVNTFQYF